MLNIKTKLRRAFTIVELVVVIAVIAALAAILIPTFANVINAANESADTSLVKNLNTIFSSEQTVTSSKPSTMSEALELAAENGYNVDKLTPSSSGDIVWDQTSNRFLLIDEEGEIVYMDGTTADDVTSAKYQLWYIASSEEEYNAAKEDGYSVYLAYDLEAGYELSASAGVDVGDNSGLVINYTATDTQKVIFNTNGGTLTIDNANATVYHYGDADVVTITAVDTASYYPYGNITTLTVVKGHIYLQSTAVVGALSIEPTEDNLADSIIIDASTSATVENVLVVVPEGSTTVASEAVKFNSTALSEKAITNIDPDTEKALTTIGEEYFGGGTGTSGSPFLISTYEHLYNMAAFPSTQYYFKQTADITVSSLDLFNNTVGFNGVYDGDGHSITVSADLENLSSVTLFHVYKSATIMNLNTVSATNCLMIVAAFCGGTAYYIELSNVNAYGPDSGFVYSTQSNISPFIYEHYYTTTAELGRSRVDLILDNCTNYVNLSNTGKCTGVFSGGFFYYTYSKTGTYPNGVEYYYTVTNCTNKGNIYGNEQAGLLVGNYSPISTAIDGNYGGIKMTAEEISKYITVSNVVNDGVIAASQKEAGIFSCYTVMNKLYESKVSGTGSFIQSTNVLSNADFTIYVQDGQFYIAGDTSDSYSYQLAITVPYVVYHEYYDENGTLTGYGAYMGRTFNIDLSVATANIQSTGTTLITSAAHKAYSYSDAVAAGVFADGTKLTYDLFEDTTYMALYVNSQGVIYLILEDPTDGNLPYFKTSDVTSFSIYAYNSNDVLVGTTTYKKTA